MSSERLTVKKNCEIGEADLFVRSAFLRIDCETGRTTAKTIVYSSAVVETWLSVTKDLKDL